MTSDDYLDRLKKLAELRDSGVLTDEEFAEQKAKVLDATPIADSPKTTTFIIKRTGTFVRDRLRAYTVQIDGQTVGSVKHGGEFRTQLPDGNHLVRLKLDGFTSPQLELNSRDGDPIIMECGPNSSAWTAIFTMWFNVHNYIYLRPAVTGGTSA